MEQSTDDNKVIAPEEAPVEDQDSILMTGEVDNTQTKPLEEVDSSASGAKDGKSTSRMTARSEEPPPNPLLHDAYEWDQCTITMVYTLLPDQTASVNVHNHKDEPIVKTFPAADVPMPEKISSVMGTLHTIWRDSTVTATFVLMPKQADKAERIIIVSVRAGTDTPIVQSEAESALPLPDKIQAMFEELKRSLPARALKRIEKDAKTESASASTTSSKTATKQTPVSSTTVNKSQLSLF